MTCTSIRKPIYLGDKPIVGTLEDPNKGYSPKYMGAWRFPKMKSHIGIYAFMNLMPQKKDF